MDDRTNGNDVRTWSEVIGSIYSSVYFPKVYSTLKQQGFENNK